MNPRGRQRQDDVLGLHRVAERVGHGVRDADRRAHAVSFPQAFCAQASIASYRSSQVVYIAPAIPGTLLVLAIQRAIREPSSSPS